MAKNSLIDLANYARQSAQVDSPAHFLLGRSGTPLNKELFQLGLLQRIANALEGNEGSSLTARLTISPIYAEEFRDLVGDRLDGRPLPLAIVGWYLQDELTLEVSLSYEDGEALFFLGRYWEFFTTQQLREGGQPHDQ